MKRTVTLDPDIAERIEQEVHREGKTVHTVVNEALRARLGLAEQIPSLEPFRVEPHDFRFISGIDLDKMNQLSDQLEAAAAAQKLGE
jgi:hypothetical protein